MMGLMPLEKEEETEDSPLCVCVPTEQGHVKTSAGRRSSSKTQLCCHPNLGLPASRTVRSKCFLFDTSLWSSVLAA